MRCLLSFFITHYTLRGGNSYHVAACGTFFVVANGAASNAFWNFGAALCVHIMLVVVELLVIVYFVVVVYVI